MIPGFTVRSSNGQVEFLLPAGSRSADHRRPQVSVARDDQSQSALVLIGQLHYRDDLARLLPPGDSFHDPSDAELALAVYERADMSGLERLEGAFSLVVWDSPRRKLVGMRDPFGSWPLFWLAQGSDIAMGTSIKPLTWASPRPALDLDYLAEFLARPYLPSELPCQQTVLKNIRRVLPGTLVEARTDGRWQCRCYWDWPARIEQVSTSCPQRVAERFRYLLRQAVEQRMRPGCMAAHLSGGMDSSSIAILARQQIADRPDRGPLHTISLTYQAAELNRERSYIQLVLDQGGPVESHLLDADPAVGFDWFGKPVPQHDEPYTGLWELSTHRMLVDAAVQAGADTILTGLGADQIVACRPLHIADCLRHGRWLSAYREASTWARAEGHGVWSVLSRCGLEPLWPALTCTLSGRLLCLDRVSGSLSAWCTPPPWLPAKFSRRYHLRDRARQAARRLYATPAQQSADLATLELSAGDWVRWHLIAPQGLEVAHPFRDPRLVCFALGIPADLRAAPGIPKPLLQVAMQGLLPEPIRTRRRKIGFDGPRSRGIARNLPWLEQLVRQSPLQDLGVLEARKLLPVLHRAAAGVGIRAAAQLDRTLALAAWFEQASSFVSVS